MIQDEVERDPTVDKYRIYLLEALPSIVQRDRQHRRSREHRRAAFQQL
jgi:hypothetical protein